MPLAGYQSEQAALSELEKHLSGEGRFADLCLTFIQKSTGKVLLTVGGRWDSKAQAFVDADDLLAVPIYVNDNQVGTVQSFGRWLAARLAGKPRKRLLITGGDRRGGKSWIIVAIAAAVAVALPNAIIWLVSPTLGKRDELEKYLKGHTPDDWRAYSARDLKFTFLNGATVKNITGDDAEALKRGEADLVVYNEPQMMTEDVLTYGAPAIIDKGGLLLFGGNPSRRRKGVWFTRIVKAAREEKLPIAEFIRISAKDNPDVDASAKGDIGELLHFVNPEAARADDEGVFLEPGQFAYAEHFDERRNTCPTLPDTVKAGHGVITAQLIRNRGGGTADTLIGADFQGWPFNAGVEVVAVGDPARPTWYVTRVVVREGDEDLFLDDAYEAWGEQQARTLFIGDASGSWQDAQHVKGRCSYDKFKARRWRIEPPRKKRTDRGEHPANPSREDRINLVNRLLDDGRLIVCMDTAADIAEDLQKCEVDSKGRPKGRHAHRTDAVGYPLYWATPLPNTSAPVGAKPRAGSVPRARPGSGFRF